jgi:hypothetical protein
MDECWNINIKRNTNCYGCVLHISRNKAAGQVFNKTFNESIEIGISFQQQSRKIYNEYCKQYKLENLTIENIQESHILMLQKTFPHRKVVSDGLCTMECTIKMVTEFKMVNLLTIEIFLRISCDLSSQIPFSTQEQFPKYFTFSQLKPSPYSIHFSQNNDISNRLKLVKEKRFYRFFWVCCVFFFSKILFRHHLYTKYFNYKSTQSNQD